VMPQRRQRVERIAVRDEALRTQRLERALNCCRKDGHGQAGSNTR